jgi:hypothetical protein
MGASWIEDIGTQLWGVGEAFYSEVRERGVLPMLRPVAPFNRPGFLAPAVTVGGLLAALLLSGIAVSALGSFVVALLALYLLLVQVFGISVEVHPFGSR